MIKKLFLLFVALAFCTPLFASAQALDRQAQIAALQQQVQMLLAQIEQLQAQKGNTPSSPSGDCITLQRSLTRGSKDTPGNADVSTLQQYLIAKGYLTGSATGYFGSMTAQAVGKMQIALGIVSNSSAPGYGMVGPKTRTTVACVVSSPIPTPAPAPAPTPTPQPQPTVSLAADPSNGAAPLAVHFIATGVTGGSQYIIEYGDGAHSDPLAAIDVCMHLVDGSGGCPKVQTDHIYAAAGTYTAQIEGYIACMWGNPRCMIAVIPHATTTISVPAAPAASTSTPVVATSSPAQTNANLSPDGSSLTPDIKGSLVTSDGSWTFGMPSGSNYSVLLNGQSSGTAIELVVTNEGKLYALSNSGIWSEYQGTWKQLDNSADGTSITAPSGSLVSGDGIWTFATTTSSGNYMILLNGQKPPLLQGNYDLPQSGGIEMVATGGRIYAQTADSIWYYYQSKQWIRGTPPGV